jgi:hypothetical protein
MDYESKLAIFKQSMSQLKPFLYQQSIAFFTSGDEGKVLSSGTLVSIDDKLFIATASHTIPAISEDDIWVFHTDPNRSTSAQMPILNKGKNPNNNPDVGFLELGANTYVDYLKERACPLEHLAILGVGRPLQSTILVGSPAEYVKKRQYAGPATIGFEPLIIAYLTIPLMESEWTSDLNLDPIKHILLEYPDTPGQQLETGDSTLLPNPEGMSGGGIWDHGFEGNVLWTNKSAKLIGIQSGWYKESPRYVCATQIIHWLRLIHNNYPDLQSVLEHHLPI